MDPQPISSLTWPLGWDFVKSVFHLQDLPPADRTEIAFVGRSNVGKSSLINALSHHKGLAKTSNTPGRTQCLNYFQPVVAGKNLPTVPFYMVDLPGYGFAKAPKTVVASWQRTMRDYLRGRPTLRRVFVLIDARHGLMKMDHILMSLLDEAGVSYQMVLTKTDKISVAKTATILEAVQKGVATHAAAFPTVLSTSAEKKQGLEELRNTLMGVVENFKGL